MTTFTVITKDNEVGSIEKVQIEKEEPSSTKRVLTLEGLNTQIAVFTNQVERERVGNLNTLSQLEEKLENLNAILEIVQTEAEKVKLKEPEPTPEYTPEPVEYTLITKDGEVASIEQVEVQVSQPTIIKEVLTLESLNAKIKTFTNLIGSERTRNVDAMDELENQLDSLNALKELVQAKAETVKLS